MRWILLGAPGSGKGTQARRILNEFNLNYISTGDLFREEVERGSILGRKVQGYIEAGNLVPDDIVIEVLLERLKPLLETFLMDGVPRTVAQAVALDEFLEEKQTLLDGVIYIDVPREIILDRLVNRWVCVECGRPRPVRDQSEECKCGGEFVRRRDDNAPVIEHRIEVYLEKTSPLIEYYRDRGLLRRVTGTGAPDDIYQDVREIIGESKNGIRVET